jgi:hypothetical protein
MEVMGNSAVECFTKYVASYAGRSVGYEVAQVLTVL